MVRLSVASDTVKVRFLCGGEVAYGDVKSGWDSDGSITSREGSMYGPISPSSFVSGDAYCGLYIGTMSGKYMTTIKSPDVYQWNAPPCRIHNVGDFALQYMSR